MTKLLTLLAKNRNRPAAPKALVSEGDEHTIYLYDAIVSDDITAEWWGGVSAQTLVPQIRAIKGGTIHLRINSPGGDVFAAQAIVQAIKDTNAKVIAHIDGYAASAATVVASAADEREIADGAMYMIHCAWTFAIGNETELRATADLLAKADSVICRQYARVSGKSEEEILKLMQAETWFTADEAVEAGLIDRVAGAVEVEASWDLSAYANAPKPAPKAVTQDDGPLYQEHRDRQQQRLQMMNRIAIT